MSTGLIRRGVARLDERVAPVVRGVEARWYGLCYSTGKLSKVYNGLILRLLLVLSLHFLPSASGMIGRNFTAIAVEVSPARLFAFIAPMEDIAFSKAVEHCMWMVNYSIIDENSACSNPEKQCCCRSRVRRSPKARKRKQGITQRIAVSSMSQGGARQASKYKHVRQQQESTQKIRSILGLTHTGSLHGCFCIQSCIFSICHPEVKRFVEPLSSLSGAFSAPSRIERENLHIPGDIYVNWKQSAWL